MLSHYVECHVIFIVMMSVVMMNVIMLNVAAPLKHKSWKLKMTDVKFN